MEEKYDFSGYATKNGIKCTDGRTILKDAFKHQDGESVPLVWQHLHNDPANILGHALLENRDDGVYCYGSFNDSKSGQEAKTLVKHGDVSSLSIFANQLQEVSKNVMHGDIKEVSLVLAGANPGAWIDNLSFAHADGSETPVEDEAIYSSGEPISIAGDASLSHAASKEDNRTVADVFNTLTEEQKTVVYAMIAQALGEKDTLSQSAINGSDGVTAIQEMFNNLSADQQVEVYDSIVEAFGDNGDALKHSNNEGDSRMKNNVFDQSTNTEKSKTLTHDQLTAIVADAKRCGSLKESFLQHAAEYGFDPIDLLFPDAQYTNTAGPEVIKRDTGWVSTFLGECTHTPFSRIKTLVADITADEARAKGYVTGNLKKEQIVPLLKRTTTPTTIYKKQKLDRDDMVDITDFDVVIWLKGEMRGQLNEELARAILLGDGRNLSDEDKINEQCIRPIVTDNTDVYIHRGSVANTATADEIIDEFIKIRKYYKGTGNPTLYTGTDLLTDMLLIKDSLGRRIYKDTAELASVLRVSKIVEVELMNGATREVSEDVNNTILGVIVNPKDYTIGADKGGQINLFDDFDIDYNQYKYLIETRVSGALTKPKSAMIIEKLPA